MSELLSSFPVYLSQTEHGEADILRRLPKVRQSGRTACLFVPLNYNRNVAKRSVGRVDTKPISDMLVSNWVE